MPDDDEAACSEAATEMEQGRSHQPADQECIAFPVSAAEVAQCTGPRHSLATSVPRHRSRGAASMLQRAGT